MNSTDGLTALINRIRAGDEDAIGELIRDHEPLVLAAIRFALEPGNALRPFITTNDILQSVHVRLVREARKAPVADSDPPPREPIDNGVGWLITVATRLVIDRSRRLPKKSGEPDATGGPEPAGPKMVPLGDLAAILTDPNPGPEERVDDRDMLHLILEQLSPEERAVADARMAGKDWKEIGKRWERPMQRRFQSLRERYQEPKNDESE
ncbi:RNA polymerase sigma factor [Gemmata sp. SH-PL17]|uniref:RNA polymerase sigma factor n=1 Tax=Gemmata sp. SH-PL17 TaxID=1630693 RepID=UPI00078C9E7B|nr:sigma-70 family RNA polymerase sigma factor [Gemmata sp. SH-PL17]AMV24234.1 RNA polymerase sigma factor [Gemmata sp. SH-PL17]